jgi:hypothetical protein
MAMSTEFNFLVVDANLAIEAQQSVVRELISAKLDLAAFSRSRNHPPARPAATRSHGAQHKH